MADREGSPGTGHGASDVKDKQKSQQPWLLGFLFVIN